MTLDEIYQSVHQHFDYRAFIVKEVQRWFSLRELVDEQTYKKYGDFAWNFLRTELLFTLLYLREYVLKVPMTINNWHTGGKFSERGLRHNMSAEVWKYTKANKQFMSAHVMGAGVDFDAKGMTAAEVRALIQAKANQLPYPIRLEDGVSWVHIDVYNDGSKEKVVLFRV